jgi:hypothetical protein
MRTVRWISLIAAIVAVLAPMAHVMELPNKLAIPGPLWLDVQQTLYRGWGPFLGGPAEITAIISTFVLLVFRLRLGPNWRLTAVAVACYTGMLLSFFFLNNPVNIAVAHWSTDTLPADWPRFRLQWEMGHLISDVLAIIALLSLLKAWKGDRIMLR